MWKTFISIRLMRQLKRIIDPNSGMMSLYTIKDGRTEIVSNFSRKIIPL